jgi:predicted nucleotidyltransferase
MLTERDRSIMELFARKVREIFPEARIYAFGSRVRGDYEEDSDLDLCILINVFSWDHWGQIRDIAWELGFANDLHIQTVIMSAVDFESGPMSVSPLIGNIKREGLAA